MLYFNGNNCSHRHTVLLCYTYIAHIVLLLYFFGRKKVKKSHPSHISFLIENKRKNKTRQNKTKQNIFAKVSKKE